MAPDLDSTIKALRSSMSELRGRYGIDRLWLFGSVARGSATETSDVDVLVDFQGPGITLLRFLELEQELTSLLGVKVDLVTRAALKQSMRDEIIQEAIAV